MAQLELLLLQFTKQNMYAFFLCLLSSSSRSLRVTWESPHTSKTVGGVPIHLWLLHIASCSFSRQSTQRTWTSWTDTPWIYQFCEETDWKIHWLACNKSQESVLEIRPKKGDTSLKKGQFFNRQDACRGCHRPGERSPEKRPDLRPDQQHTLKPGPGQVREQATHWTGT